MKSLFLLITFYPLFSVAQLLPSPEIIRLHGIKKIDVWNHQLPDVYKNGIDPATMEKIEKSEHHVEDTVSTLLRTWYFNEKGFPYRCTGSYGTNQFETNYRYDDHNRTIERTDTENGVVTFRQLVKRQEDSSFVFKVWRNGALESHYLASKDSIPLYIFPREQGQLPYLIYKRDSNYIQKASYVRGKLANTVKEQWIVNSEGKPTGLDVDFQQFRRATKRNGLQKSFRATFSVNEQGTTESIEGIRYPLKHFYSQVRKSSFINAYHLQDFRLDTIVDRTEDIVLQTFDIKDPKYFYSFTYYHNLKEFNAD